RRPNFSVDPLCLPTGMVSQHAQVLRRRLYLLLRPHPRLCRNLLHHPRNPMNKKILPQILFVLLGASPALPGPQMIAFERNDAVWMANPDGTGEKKIADGMFPAIPPDGTRGAFNTVEKTSDTSYVRHMAVVDVATGNVTVFKDVPSTNSYYPSWTADGKQILFTTRPKEVWDLVAVNADGTNFRMLKPGEQNAVTRYSPMWARNGQSVVCEDMTNVCQTGTDGAAGGEWKTGQIVRKGDMICEGRIHLSPDGKRLLFITDTGEESARKYWD